MIAAFLRDEGDQQALLCPPQPPRLSLDSPPRSFVFSNGIGLTPIVLCSAAFVFDWVLEAKERLEQIGRILQFLYQTEILVRPPPESFTGTFILCPRTEVGTRGLGGVQEEEVLLSWKEELQEDEEDEEAQQVLEKSREFLEWLEQADESSSDDEDDDDDD